MLSPRAVHLVLRHFDSVDQVVSQRLMRKRPWGEEALTHLFCDLLDFETQEEEKVAYTISQLREDLAKFDELLDFKLRIDTHQYPKHLERWVTQSDIGVIVNYENRFDPVNSRSVAWLLQAKRLFPSKSGVYEIKSKFESVDSDQHARMKLLRDWAKEDFIKYLLYCPRPRKLESTVRAELNQLRTNALSECIFDFTLGLELRDDLLSVSPTTAAGLFVAGIDEVPKTLAETHAQLFKGTIPFAWFIIQHFATGGHLFSEFQRRLDAQDLGSKTVPSEVEKLVRGDHTVLEGFALPDNLATENPPRILPAHTVELTIRSGLQRG